MNSHCPLKQTGAVTPPFHSNKDTKTRLLICQGLFKWVTISVGVRGPLQEPAGIPGTEGADQVKHKIKYQAHRLVPTYLVIT